MTSYLHSDNEIILVQAPGIWIPCQSIQSPPNANPENTLTTFNLLKPKRYTPENDNFCIVPVMPSVPPFITEATLKEAQNHVQISAPIKGSQSPYSDKNSRGYRSGARSAIVPCRKVESSVELSSSDWVIGTDKLNGSKYVVDFDNGDALVRLKGCGMWLPEDDLPFPGITLMDSSSIYASEGQSVSEIRGVCFENTSCTEMYVTSQLEKSFKKIGFISGNHPLGFWIYNNLQNDASPLINKTVSVFETYGDRRLESHLITGLERLLSKKYDQSFAKGVVEAITPLYKGIEDKFPSNEHRTFGKVIKIRLSTLYSKISDGSLFNFEDFVFPELSESALREKGFVPTHEIYKVLEHLDKDFANFAKLFGNFGFEMGKILSIIHRNSTLWGSYTDHSKGAFHCNAHCDNLVVLTKEQCLSNKDTLQILAPLDFDMSFRKESAINFWSKPPRPDPTYVTDNIWSELDCMISDAGGYFATVDVSSAIKPRPQPPGLLTNVLWLLRDCMVYEFYQGYQKINVERCKGNDVSVDDMYKIIIEGLNESMSDNS